MTGALFAMTVTAAIEPPIVGSIFRRWDMAAIALVTTIVTNLAMNLWLARMFARESTFVIVGEACAFLIEAAVYYAVSRDARRSLLASAVANAVSFLA